MNINFKDLNTDEYMERVLALNEGAGRLVHIVTFGCQQNVADSEKIKAMAVMMGYQPTEEPGEADLIVVNTCAIRKHAEMKALSLLGRFKEFKTQKPNLVIAVVGCMAAEPHMARKLERDFHYVSFTLEPNMLHRLPEVLYGYLKDNKREFIFGADKGDIVEGIEPVRADKYKAWVSIMYGCNNFCSYCIVPYVRGRERSRDSSAVLEECRALIASGCKEITLLGQNVNSYKSDMDFAELVEAVADIPGEFLVRFMTSHPKDVSDKLIDVLHRRGDKVAQSFHLPLQSGSDRILKAMNRTYDSKHFMDVVNKLREAVPDISISSDVIVGFPGETEEDFNFTLELMKKIRFDMVYSFIYSPREGTKAAKMENQIPEDVKKARIARLLELQEELSHEKNAPYVGTVQRVLVDSVEKRSGVNVFSGRTPSNKRVRFESENALIGEFKYVKIYRTSIYDLYGEEIER
jgi:tRNA-2-methylthio-N6-dimethylallyladenosine synthase